ncbi:zinc-binding dehydrogenase, partial [Amycolatopsis acidiphila]
LGHLGVKLAHALGAEVTVLGRSTAKREDSLCFGADHYVSTAEPGGLQDLASAFDLIVSTAAADVDVEAYLGLLRLDGVLVLAGVGTEPISLHGGLLNQGRRVVTSTKNGSIAQTQEMLDFCAGHGIVAEIEKITAAQTDKALDRLHNGDVRYRFVIDASTFPAQA